MDHYAANTRTFDTLSLYLGALLGGCLTRKDQAIAAAWGRTIRGWGVALWFGVTELFYPEPAFCTCALCEPAPTEVVEPALQARLEDLAREACRGEMESLADLGWQPTKATDVGTTDVTPALPEWVEEALYGTQYIEATYRHTDEAQAVVGSLWVCDVAENEDEEDTDLITANPLDQPTEPILLGVPVSGTQIVGVIPPPMPAAERPEDVIDRILNGTYDGPLNITPTAPKANPTLCVPDDLSQLDWLAFKALCRGLEIKVKGKRENLEALVKASLGKS